MSKIITVAAVLAVGCFGTAVWAAGGEAVVGGAVKGMLRDAIIQKFDKNGDGRLDEQERAAAREAAKERRQEFLKKYDTNGDGKIDAQERAAILADMKARHPKLYEHVMAKFDTNKDGALDDTEWAAAKEFIKERRQERLAGGGQEAKPAPKAK